MYRIRECQRKIAGYVQSHIADSICRGTFSNLPGLLGRETEIEIETPLRDGGGEEEAGG